MNHTYSPRRLGVTLTELLVVLVIISILATLAVPVYINRAENARKSTALAECRVIADAEEACVSIHTFYVPLQILDDMPKNSNQSYSVDAINREDFFLIDPNDVLTRGGIPIQQHVTASSDYTFAQMTDVRANNLIDDWQGPFLNPARVYRRTARESAETNPTLLDNQFDFPLDPWGNPYRFYCPLGHIGSGALNGNPEAWNNYNSGTFSSNFSDGLIVGPRDNRFDRYAIISFGPDGKSDSMSPVAIYDDIYYEFGSIPSETHYQRIGVIVIASPTP